MSLSSAPGWRAWSPRDLAAAGRSVIVLEARDRVGGRVVGHPIGDGKVAEMGGQYAGPAQDRILDLAADLGVETFPTYDEGADSGEFAGQRAVISVPPLLAGRIGYEPALPHWRDQLTQRMPMGSVIKCQAVYDEPFWRADGLSGQATGDGRGSRVVFDNSPPDGTPGILLAFVEGDEARTLGRASADVRRGIVLDSLARYFGPVS
jgi:monoamine oxidase